MIVLKLLLGLIMGLFLFTSMISASMDSDVTPTPTPTPTVAPIYNTFNPCWSYFSLAKLWGNQPQMNELCKAYNYQQMCISPKSKDSAGKPNAQTRMKASGLPMCSA